FGQWDVVCRPDDGARLVRLAWAGCELLTGEPEAFVVPVADFGAYERRPVFGYDDCFPTVDACGYPGGGGVPVADHGELCWRQWELGTEPGCLVASVHSELLPVTFVRRMRFVGDLLRWEFEVVNRGA